jgi:O-phosphoseryl-tRNA(Cys) synthetase
MRELLLESGFDEIQTSYFVGRGELKELTGNLYPVFRDSIYHMAWIRTEPLAPTSDVEKKLRERFPDIDMADLWNILDGLDEDTSGEELLFLIHDEIGLSLQETVELMNLVPGLSRGDPKTGDITLRSFMPTSWLSTLEATFHGDKLPLRLFTTATAFRREPTLDSSHIETYNILSIAIADDEMTKTRDWLSSGSCSITWSSRISPSNRRTTASRSSRRIPNLRCSAGTWSWVPAE